VEFFYVFLKEAGEVPPSAGIPSEAKKPKKPVAHRYFFQDVGSYSLHNLQGYYISLLVGGD
jgi:hypothetical protein